MNCARHWLVLSLLCVAAAGCAMRVSDPAPLVLVAGGSGRTGVYILESLQASGYVVRALTQNRAGAVERLGEQWDWREVDVRDPDQVAQATRGVDYVISALGAGQRSGPNSFEFVDYRGVRNLVDAAVQAGAKHFVLISSGAAGPYRERSKMAAAGNVRHCKTLGENHLKRSGLAYTIIGPGLEDKPASAAGLRALSRRDYSTGLVARGDVARVAVACLKESAARDKTFALIRDKSLSPNSWRELLPAISLDADTEEAPPIE